MPRAESTSVSLRRDLSEGAREFDDLAAQRGFIARYAAPPIGVEEQTGNFPIFNRETFKKPAESTDRKEDGAYNRIVGEFGTGTYSCEEHGLEYPISDRRRKKYATFLDSDQEANRILRHQILMAWEQRVAALYAAESLTSIAAATAWSTSASAVPIDDIVGAGETLQDACGIPLEFCTLIIPRADYREMIKCASFNDKLKYTYPGIQPGQVKPDVAADILGVKRVLRPSGIYDSKEEGVAESVSQIWGAAVMYLAVLADPDDPMDTPSAARTVVWRDSAAEIPVVEMYREDNRGQDVLRMRDDTDEIFTTDADILCVELSSDA